MSRTSPVKIRRWPKFVALTREIHRKLRAVLAPAAHFAADADDPPFARAAIMFEIAVVLGAIRLRHEHRDISTDHFAGG